MYLENNGGTGIEGNHWKRMLLFDDIMTYSDNKLRDLKFSLFDYAILKDSGWYTVKIFLKK